MKTLAKNQSCEPQPGMGELAREGVHPLSGSQVCLFPFCNSSSPTDLFHFTYCSSTVTRQRNNATTTMTRTVVLTSPAALRRSTSLTLSHECHHILLIANVSERSAMTIVVC